MLKLRIFEMRNVSAVLMLALMNLACSQAGTRSPSNPSLPAPQSGLARVEGGNHFSRLEKRCEDTGGSWSQLLLSCSCPGNSVFFGSDGCRDIQLEPLTIASGQAPERASLVAWLSHPLKNSKRLMVDVDQLSDDEVRLIVKSLQAGAGDILKGLSISSADKRASTFVTFSAETKRSYETRQLDVFDGTVEVAHSLYPGPSILTLNDKIWDVECRDHFEDRANGVVGICGNLARWLKILRMHEQGGELAEQHYFASAECQPFCTKMADAVFADSQTYASFQILYRGDWDVRRRLTINTASAQLSLFLSPTGQVELQVLKSMELTRDGAQSTLLAFDGSWNEVVVESANHIGWGDLSGALAVRKQLPALLPFESTLNSLNENFNEPGPGLVLMESSINIQVPALAQRLKLEPHFEQAIVALPAVNALASLPGTFFSAGLAAAPVKDLFALFGINDSAEFETHGTEMASIAVRDLPQAQITLLPPHYFDLLPISASVDIIRASHSRVVNISQDFGQTLTDCEAKFEILIRALPEVLFVVGAGNTGTFEPDTCPAKLTRTRDLKNLLAVAGSQGMNLHSKSSFGNGVATLAAPFESECLSFNQIDARTNFFQKNCAGTSVSTAVVSNQALKDQQLHGASSWSLESFLARLRRRCVQSSVAVQWGCVLQPDAHGVE